MWQPQTASQVGEIPIPAARGIESLIVSPSKRRVAALLSESDTTTIIDAEAGAIDATIELPRTRSLDLLATPDTSFPGIMKDGVIYKNQLAR